MANTRRPPRGQWGAHTKYFLLLCLSLFLFRGLSSCMVSTASKVQNTNCAAADAGTTQLYDNRVFVWIPEYKWRDKPSHQCQNFLHPEMLVLHHNHFTLPNTAMEFSCISTAEEIKLERDPSSSELLPGRRKICAAHAHPPNKSCPRCQTGPWRASLPHLTCWTTWSPQFICWDELTHLLKVFWKLDSTYEDWEGGPSAISSALKLVLIVTMTVLTFILLRRIITMDIQSSPQEMTTLLHRQRKALKRFTRAVNELFRKILRKNRETKFAFSVRRIERIRCAAKSFRKSLRRLVNRRKWTLGELPPSRFKTSAQQGTQVRKKEAEATTNEVTRPWGSRWHTLNYIHRVMLPCEMGASGVHTYVEKQQQDTDKLVNFWREIFRRRRRKYQRRGFNRCKDTTCTTQQANTGFPRDAVQQQGLISRASVHSNAKDDISERPGASVCVQQGAEHLRMCMSRIFAEFLQETNEWRDWQRSEKMNFIEVVLNQLERWSKLQLAFEGRILESTFKLSVITTAIVRKFEDISIVLTDEETKGSKIVRYASLRGKRAGGAVIDAHSGTWTPLTEAALDARLIRQTKFLRTQFEEQKKFLGSTTAHIRSVESSLEQVCHDHMKRLTTNLQRSFDRETEKHLAQLTHQQPSPTPSVRMKKDLHDMEDTQKKLLDHCQALAGATQEITRQHFQDQKQQLDRMATKLHLILDRHMERDKSQEQKLQQMIDACLEKNRKQLVIALQKNSSQGSTASASLLQQQNELRRMCEAHKDQGERISHMVEGLVRQQKTQQPTLEQEQDTTLSMERKLVKVLREEIQATKVEMAEKLGQIRQQSRAPQCCFREESRAEVEKMVDSVTFQLQQQRQEQRCLHETLLIQRRDTLELLKHFTHLALSPEPQQAGTSLSSTTPTLSNNNVTSTTKVHSNPQTLVYSVGRLDGDSITAHLQADKSADPRRPFHSNRGFQRERQTTDSFSLASAVAFDMHSGKQLHHALEDQIGEEIAPLQPFHERPPMPVKAEVVDCRNAVLTDTSSCQKQQGAVQKTPTSWTQVEAEPHVHTEKFEELLERWTRSVGNAEVMDRNPAKLIVGPGESPHEAVQTRQESNFEAQVDRSKMDESSCSRGRRRVCGNESLSIDRVTQLLCTDHLVPTDLQSVKDLMSPLHRLQTGESEAERNPIIPCPRAALVARSGANATTAEEHCLVLGKGHDVTQLGAAHAAQQPHSDLALQRQLAQEKLLEQKRQPEVALQYEEAAPPDLQNLVLDWGND